MWSKKNYTHEVIYSALTLIGDCIITTDARGRITSMNAPAETLTGWTFEEANGKASGDILRLVNYDTRDVIDNPLEKVLGGAAVLGWSDDTVLIARGGGERIIDYSAAILRGVIGIKGAIAIFRNITERYSMQQKLLESEERLKAVTNAARIGLVMIDRERRYVYVNNYYLQMIGVSTSNLVGKFLPDVLPQVYDQIKPNLDRAFTGERITYEVKGLYRKERGLNRTYRVTYEPQLRQSLVTHVVIMVIDITDIQHEALAMLKNAGQALE